MLRLIVAIAEHDARPHGHVLHQQTVRRFVVYAASQLLIPPRRARIRAAFALLHDKTVTRTDTHDSQSTRLPRDED